MDTIIYVSTMSMVQQCLSAYTRMYSVWNTAAGPAVGFRVTKLCHACTTPGTTEDQESSYAA